MSQHFLQTITCEKDKTRSHPHGDYYVCRLPWEYSFLLTHDAEAKIAVDHKERIKDRAAANLHDLVYGPVPMHLNELDARLRFMLPPHSYEEISVLLNSIKEWVQR